MDRSTKAIVGIVVAIVVLGGGYAFWQGQQAQPTSQEGASAPSPSVSQATGPIKVGVLQPMTGDIASMGINTKAAVELAVQEINESGGINGRNIEVVTEDSKCTPADATSAATKLINIDKVVAVIGGLCSSETLAVAPIANQAGVPIISAGSTNPKITEAGDYVFRFIPSDLSQGKFAAEYLVSTLEKKKIAILYCLSDWCAGLKDVARERIPEIGGTVVAEEGYQQDTNDLRSQITKIKAANPDAVYFLGYTKATVIGLKQMKELGLSVPILGGDAWDDVTIPKEAGAAANGARYTLTDSRQLSDTFVAEIKRRTNGQELDTYSPRGYDIMKKLGEIMRTIGATSEQIKSGLYQVKDYQGVADTYTLDSNGDMVGGMFTVKEFQDGKASKVK